MHLDTVSYTLPGIQGFTNAAKDRLIERINADHGLQLDPANYVFVVRSRGCLGRAFDKLFGRQDADHWSLELLRVTPAAKPSVDTHGA